ncbi:hypothetical protein CVT26_003960 [Gymnopilus dilepis]|uniref:Uncharacterized protein n=1 Tax=Gymnopilus dilepis TaxID=231916 RepID=A0A409WKL0_9AGAR|nr:hypothetical protein CVT26_003960 [Gymnopilus dilepis]
MMFYLPAFKVRSRRIVRIDAQIWDIWSPNSITHLFYPGLRDLSIDLEKDQPEDRRRCDGHLGCFDPTLSPQFFEPERPWLGFIQKDSTSSLTLSFDKAVDLLAKTQRAIKYANAILAEDKNKPKGLKSVEGADESLTGTCISGCDEKDGVFFLRYRVPCFIIHIVDGILEGDRIFPYHPQCLHYSYLCCRPREAANDFAILPTKGVPMAVFADRIHWSPVVKGYDGEKYEDPRTKPSSLNQVNPVGLPRQYPEEEGVIPPPVEDVVPKGSWMTCFENGQDCSVKMGKKDEASGTTLYDWRNKRK